MPQGSVTSRRSTLSWAVSEVFRDLGLLPSTTRVCEELGVASGELEDVLLGPANLVASSERSRPVEDVIGGNEGENMVGGRAVDLTWDGGMR